VELKNQIEFLKKQLEKAEDRETKANARIDTLLTLIEMKPPQANISTFTEQQSDQDIATDPRSKKPNEGGLTTQEIKRIPVPEHIEPEPEKRGFWSRFFKPYG
ncbi:DNA-binding protein, partial [Acinetobacter baumannii]